MAAKFEHIKGYEDLPLPSRATGESAGYDLYVAEDTIVPSFKSLRMAAESEAIMNYDKHNGDVLTLKEVSDVIKTAGCKLTLVPTGVKCKLDPETYLELSVRSSTPLKSWLILANGVGIIDADYYGSAESDGHIYFQLINLTPWNVQLKKGDKIGQGIIKSYLKTEDDCPGADRTGGFGSSDIDNKLFEIAEEVGVTIDELTDAKSNILKEYRELQRGTPEQVGEALQKIISALNKNFWSINNE